MTNLAGSVGRVAVVAVLAALTVTGCSSDDAPDRDTEPVNPNSSTTAAAEVAAPKAQPASFDRMLFIPPNARPGDELGGPDWMVAAFGSLWVKRDNNAVERISRNGERQATIDAGIFTEPVCQGIGVTDTAVWACASTDKLIRIDPATDEYTVVPVSKLNEQGRLTYSVRLLWVLNSDGDTLQGLADDGHTRRTIDLGAYCTDTASTVHAGFLWVVCSYDGSALRVDLRSGEVVDRVTDLPHADAIADAGDVWVSCDDGLVRLDAESLEPVSTIPMDVSAIRPADGGVVVREAGDAMVSVVDGGTGEITTRLSSPRTTSGGDVVEVAGRWWVTSNEDNLLLRLRTLD